MDENGLEALEGAAFTVHGGPLAEGLFHKLRCIEGRVAQAAVFHLIWGGTEANHGVAPDRAVIGLKQAWGLLPRPEEATCWRPVTATGRYRWRRG